MSFLCCSIYGWAVEKSKRQVRTAFKTPDGTFLPPPINCNIKPANNIFSLHYFFDFAQRMYYPSNPLQQDPIWDLLWGSSLTNKFCDWQGLWRRTGYQCSCQHAGWFNHIGLGETTVTLYADNCMGQNKNNTVMQSGLVLFSSQEVSAGLQPDRRSDHSYQRLVILSLTTFPLAGSNIPPLHFAAKRTTKSGRGGT